MKVEVWKCPYTGLLYEDEAEFKRQTWHAARRTALMKRKNKATATIEEKLAELRRTALTFSEIESFLVENGSAVCIRNFIMQASKFESLKGIPSWYKSAEIVQVSLSMNQNVSWLPSNNWHRKPIGLTGNAERDPNQPLEYACWHGRVSYVVNSDFSFYHLLDGTGLNTGSGGGGQVRRNGGKPCYESKYDVFLFLADWPAMAAVETAKALCCT